MCVAQTEIACNLDHIQTICVCAPTSFFVVHSLALQVAGDYDCSASVHIYALHTSSDQLHYQLSSRGWHETADEQEATLTVCRGSRYWRNTSSAFIEDRRVRM